MRPRPIAALFALAVLAVAPSASASTPGDDAHLVVVHDSVTTPAQPVSEVAVACPAGERAISGGVLTDSGHSPMSLAADGPLDETGLTANTTDGDVPRFWYSAIANGYAGPETYTHYAICSASSDATVQATNSLVPDFDPGPGGVGGSPGRFGQTSHCPSGTRAISGGFGSSEEPSRDRRTIFDQPLVADGSIIETTTGSVAEGWYFFGENYAETEWLMKVFVVCSADSQATVQATSFDSEGPAQASAACPGGGRATGGGFGSTTDTTSPDWISTAPATGAGAPASRDGDVPRAWFGRVDATQFSGTYRVYALCEPGPPSAGAGAPASASTGRRAAALKKCRKKRSKRARKKCRKRAHALPV